MDWETLYCPHRHCRGYGKPFAQGHVVKNRRKRYDLSLFQLGFRLLEYF